MSNDRTKRSPLAAVRPVFAELEAAVLAPRALSVGEQMQRLAWTRDAPDAYCARCGGDVGKGEATVEGCAQCRRTALAYDGVVRLGRYVDPLAGWIGELKFHQQPSVARTLGAMLGEAVGEWVSVEGGRRADRHPCGSCIVVPLPTSPLRRLSRGIDHTAHLAKAVGRSIGAPVVPALVARWHAPQHQRSGADRRRNLRPVFRLRSPRHSGRLAGRTVVLVDDVTTTGSTARAAALALTGRTDLRFTPAADGPRRVVLAVVAVAPPRAG
jgi:ComF family protein